MIDSSQWRNSEAYRTQARNEVESQRAALMLPRTAPTGPKMASASQKRLCATYGIDCKDMTFSEAAQAINAYAKANSRRSPNALTAAEMAANEAECLRVFGPV
jgi:hypothetical protein